MLIVSLLVLLISFSLKIKQHTMIGNTIIQINTFNNCNQKETTPKIHKLESFKSSQDL